MIFGAILAGGSGSRMNISEMPKQFLPLGDKPIVIHTLEKFLICGRFDAVYVGVHPNWVLHMEDLLGRYITQRDRVHITAAAATATRRYKTSSARSKPTSARTTGTSS